MGLNNPSHTGSFAPLGLSYIECLKTPPSPGTDLDCSAPIPIACGETKVGNNANGIAAANTYNCFPNLVDGAEVVYQFTNPVAQNVLITLTGLQEDLELLLLKPCDRNNCMDYSDRTGTSPEAIFAQSLPAGTYFIVVEGYLGSTSTYSINVQCGNSIVNGALNCTGAPAITCGQTQMGNTATGSDQVIQYGCAPAYMSGKEKVFVFSTPVQKVVQVKLSGLSADLDLFVLDQCDPNDCFKSSNKSGTEEEGVVFTATAGKTYYIVVDGYFDQEGSFSLSTTCFDPCPPNVDCPYEIGGPGNQQCINAQVLECGQPVSGNNSTGQANASFYACPGSHTNGKEVVYKFQNTTTQDITIILSGLSANLDLYLLNGCSIFNCLFSSHKSGNSNEGMVAQALPPGEYFIVVDGYNGAVSGYSLVVTCSDPAVHCQMMDLVEGTNFISSNVVPLDPAIEVMFPPSAQSKIVAIENQYNQSFSPFAQSNPNDFDDWDFRKGYRIKVLQPVTIQVCGEKADPHTPIPMSPPPRRAFRSTTGQLT
ncbi:MAG: PPC domain-containing protein [Saprospiraceae bacterium]|nr:PPC domain-containing protein [Saprospiraceae bacterium]